MLLQMAGFLSFSWLNNIPLYMYFILSLSIYPSIDTSIVSLFWLLWIMLLWTWGGDTWDPAFTSFGYKPRRETVGSYDSSIFKFFLGFSILSSIVVFQFTFPPVVHKHPLFSTSLLSFVILLTVILLIKGVRWHLIMFFFFFCISVISVGVHLFLYCGPLVYILWRNVYSKYMLTFNQANCLFAIKLPCDPAIPLIYKK